MPNELYYNEWIKNLTIQEMDNCDDGRPFFMWCSFPDPHFPFGPPAPYNKMFDPEKVPDPVAWDDDRKDMNESYQQDYYTERGIFSVDGGPTDLTLEQIKETKALTWGQVKSVDDSVGQVMAHLKETGKLENTIVIFLADHGELMGDHGLFCKGPFHYEGLLRVPFIVSYPKKLKKNVRTDALAGILDFMPTVLDLAEVPYPDNPVKDWEGPFEGQEIYKGRPRLPGKSLVPVMTGEAADVQQSLLIEDDDDIRDVNVRTIIKKDCKLTLYAGREFGELFDLKNDPEERRNLWDSKPHEALKLSLLQELANQMTQTQPRIKRRISIA